MAACSGAGGLTVRGEVSAHLSNRLRKPLECASTDSEGAKQMARSREQAASSSVAQLLTPGIFRIVCKCGARGLQSRCTGLLDGCGGAKQVGVRVVVRDPAQSTHVSRCWQGRRIAYQKSCKPTQSLVDIKPSRDGGWNKDTRLEERLIQYTYEKGEMRWLFSSFRPGSFLAINSPP